MQPQPEEGWKSATSSGLEIQPCPFSCVFSEMIVDGGGVSFLSQDGCAERCMETSFVGMHFFNRETCSKVKNNTDTCPLLFISTLVNIFCDMTKWSILYS